MIQVLRDHSANLVLAHGAASVVVGVALWSASWAWIVAGVELLALAIMLTVSEVRSSGT